MTMSYCYSPVDPEVYCISGISVGSTWSRVTVIFLSSLSLLILVVECHGIAVLALSCSNYTEGESNVHESGGGGWVGVHTSWLPVFWR